MVIINCVCVMYVVDEYGMIFVGKFVDFIVMIVNLIEDIWVI